MIHYSEFVLHYTAPPFFFYWNCLLSTQTLYGHNQTKLCESIFDAKSECFYGDYFLISGHGQFKVFFKDYPHLVHSGHKLILLDTISNLK